MNFKSFYILLVCLVFVALKLFIAGRYWKEKPPEELVIETETGKPMRGDYWEGQKLLKVYGCAVCHQIDGISSEKESVGPPLTDWGKRSYIAGTMTNDPKKLIQWIQNPHEVNPETAMPDLGVSKQEALDMATYLFNQGTQDGDR
ncbi:MAG: c-type cytochrome [Candidatus Omnitrophica bacterium]|nr:c-type cytochrome [Candidatus Omnitrophota bacterium]